MSLRWLCHVHSDQALLQGHHSLNDYHVSSTSRDTRCCRIHPSIFHRFSLDRVACRRGGGELTARYMSHKHDSKQTWTMRRPLTSFRLDKKMLLYCRFRKASAKFKPETFLPWRNSTHHCPTMVGHVKRRQQKWQVGSALVSSVIGDVVRFKYQHRKVRKLTKNHLAPPDWNAAPYLHCSR